MKSNHFNQHRNIQSFGAGLLPNYFNKIGIVVMVLTVLPGVLVKLKAIEMAPAQKDTLKLLTMNFFILGLLLVAWAKDKLENQTTMTCRLKALSLTFIWAALYAIGKPLTDLLFNDSIADLSAQELVLGMLVSYLFFYLIQKKGQNRISPNRNITDLDQV